MREGAVGLLAIAGTVIAVGLGVWLQGTLWGGRSYKVVVEFADADGIQVGAPVTYRGIRVGGVTRVQPQANHVLVELDINDPELRIPANPQVAVNRMGLIGEANLSIMPMTALVDEQAIAGPMDRNCDSTIVVCKGDRLIGETPLNYGSLIRALVTVADTITSERFKNSAERAITSISGTSQDIRRLSRNLASLAKTAEGEVGTVANTLRAIERTADQVGTTSVQFGQLAEQTNGAIAANRQPLATTLTSISQTSNTLRGTLTQLQPMLQSASSGELIQNLELLSANAAQASENVRQFTDAINDPTTPLMLRQTLDSARSTFQNVEKITADLDELTGDPRFRDSLRNTVIGLGQLLSSTEVLYQETLAIEAAQTSPRRSHPGQSPAPSFAPGSHLGLDLGSNP
jgi:phospholipid/cholesterol/gamma-HCH transport system substrate-binding protein